MKVIKENEAYVQKKDLIFMQYSLNNLPESIVNGYFAEGSDADIDVYGDYDFIKFEDESEINFIKDQDYILNMTVVEGLTIEQIIEIGKTLAKEGNNLLEEMYSSNVKDEEEFFIKYKKVNYKIDVLMDILAYKQGLLNLNVPESKVMETEEQVVCIAADQTQQRAHNYGEWEQLPNGDEQRVCLTCGYSMVRKHDHNYDSSYSPEDVYEVRIAEDEKTEGRAHLYEEMETPSTGTGKSL